MKVVYRQLFDKIHNLAICIKEQVNYCNNYNYPLLQSFLPLYCLCQLNKVHIAQPIRALYIKMLIW